MFQMLYSWWLKLTNRDTSCDNSVTEINEKLEMSEIVTSQNGTDPKSGPDGGPEKKKKTKKLGHEELLRLLSVFEGELQGFGFFYFSAFVLSLEPISKSLKDCLGPWRLWSFLIILKTWRSQPVKQDVYPCIYIWGKSNLGASWPPWKLTISLPSKSLK